MKIQCTRKDLETFMHLLNQAHQVFTSFKNPDNTIFEMTVLSRKDQLAFYIKGDIIKDATD